MQKRGDSLKNILQKGQANIIHAMPWHERKREEPNLCIPPPPSRHFHAARKIASPRLKFDRVIAAALHCPGNYSIFFLPVADISLPRNDFVFPVRSSVLSSFCFLLRLFSVSATITKLKNDDVAHDKNFPVSPSSY